MLRRVKNVSWRAHLTNEQLYGQIPKLSVTIKRRRLALAGHVSRHNEPSGSLIFWTPEEPRRRGRPNITLKDVLQADTGLNSNEMKTVMADRQIWKTNFIMSPNRRIGCTYLYMYGKRASYLLGTLLSIIIMSFCLLSSIMRKS